MKSRAVMVEKSNYSVWVGEVKPANHVAEIVYISGNCVESARKGNGGTRSRLTQSRDSADRCRCSSRLSGFESARGIALEPFRSDRAPKQGGWDLHHPP